MERTQALCLHHPPVRAGIQVELPPFPIQVDGGMLQERGREYRPAVSPGAGAPLGGLSIVQESLGKAAQAMNEVDDEIRPRCGPRRCRVHRVVVRFGVGSLLIAIGHI